MGRSREFDDPTAYIAIRHILKEERAISYRASPEEIQRYEGVVFQSNRPMTDSKLRRIQYAAAIATKKSKDRL